MKRKYKPLLRATSAVLGNLSAGWFGLVLVAPNFTDITKIESILTLTKDAIFGIVFLVLTTIVERMIEK